MSYERNIRDKNEIDEMESIFEDLEEPQLASKWTRLGTYVIDIIVIQGISFVFGLVLALLQLDSILLIDNWLVDILFSAIILSIYYIVIESKTGGKSIGKLVTNTRVVTLDNQTPDFDTIVKRSLCRNIPFDGLSFIGEHSTGWHDSLSNTKVIQE